MHKTIQSAQNPSIKKLLRLQEKSRERKKEQLFVIEGFREVNLARKGGYEICEIYFCPELCPEEKTTLFDKIPKTAITLDVYRKIAYRGSTEGLVALAKTKSLSLEKLRLESKNPLILVAESPEKPGNIGALLRTADAANLDAVIIANPKTDLFNPNIVRSSVGGLFTNQIAVGNAEEIVQFLTAKKISIQSAVLQESINYLEADFTVPTAIVVGSESTGLNAIWREKPAQKIKIPMRGKIDSMNVSVAAAILVFEAQRQRGKDGLGV